MKLYSLIQDPVQRHIMTVYLFIHKTVFLGVCLPLLSLLFAFLSFFLPMTDTQATNKLQKFSRLCASLQSHLGRSNVARTLCLWCPLPLSPFEWKEEGVSKPPVFRRSVSTFLQLVAASLCLPNFPVEREISKLISEGSDFLCWSLVLKNPRRRRLRTEML